MSKQRIEATLNEVSPFVYGLDRINSITERLAVIRALGYKVEERPLSGGVGKVSETKSEIRIKIASGKGRFNYSYCIILNK